MSESGFIGRMLFTIGGLLAWAAHFTVIYGFTAVACAQGFAGADILGFDIVPFVISVATIIALLGTLAVLAIATFGRGPIRASPGGQPTKSFLRYVTVALAALSLIAIVWNALPVLIVPLCT